MGASAPKSRQSGRYLRGTSQLARITGSHRIDFTVIYFGFVPLYVPRSTTLNSARPAELRRATYSPCMPPISQAASRTGAHKQNAIQGSLIYGAFDRAIRLSGTLMLFQPP